MMTLKQIFCLLLRSWFELQTVTWKLTKEQVKVHCLGVIRIPTLLVKNFHYYPRQHPDALQLQ